MVSSVLGGPGCYANSASMAVCPAAWGAPERWLLACVHFPGLCSGPEVFLFLGTGNQLNLHTTRECGNSAFCASRVLAGSRARTFARLGASEVGSGHGTCCLSPQCGY